MTRTFPEFFAQRPGADEYNPSYDAYIALVPDGNLLPGLSEQHGVTQQALRGLTEAQALFRPAPAEWSIKQVIGHLIDSERIFAYRLLRFARGDERPLRGYEQGPYVDAARFDTLPLADLLEEFAAVRAGNVLMIAGLDEPAWKRGGIANDHPVTARALGWTIAGHERHHLLSLREKYLPR
jgi:inactivated superfamily I helicase